MSSECFLANEGPPFVDFLAVLGKRSRNVRRKSLCLGGSAPPVVYVRSMDDDKGETRKWFEADMAAWAARRAAENAANQDYFQDFADALESEDLTGVLIRGHLYVENEMNNLLDSALPRFHDADIVERKFADKLSLLYGMGLISLQQRNAIKKLNSLRNETAHMATPGVIPVVTADMVNHLWDALGEELQGAFQGKYSRTENTAANLRQMIMDIMIRIHILAGMGKEGLRDMVRYNTTGETVQQRIENAYAASENDLEPLKSVKISVRKLPYEQRNNLRIWMDEVYHD
uniref:DUF4145 domain-containing protein n=1 Tax=mine drainage metagenome TaxID=410659 RepID=E6Q5Q8_9ZZZZ